MNAFTIEGQVERLLDLVGGPSADEIEEAGGRIGRNHYPALVCDLYFEGLVAPEVAAVVVPSAWSACEFPALMLDEDIWSLLFELAGYTVEGVPADRPAHPIRLWRGSIPEHRNGWSWTDDEDLAHWFADRPHNAGRGQVWTAEVAPARLLARISEQRAGESEYVVDARGLSLADSLRTKGGG